MGMLRALDALPTAARPPAQLFYAARSPELQIFGDALDELDPDETWLCQWHAFSSAGDHLTPAGVLERAGEHPERARWYICGPEILKRDLQEELVDAGTPLDRIHAEVFATDSAPAYRVPAVAPGELVATVRVAETGEDLDARPGETLLATLERHGYRPPANCGVGACGSCKLRLLSGRAEPAGEALSARARGAGYVLACVAQPMGDVTIASGGEPPREGVMAGARSGPARGARWRVRLAALVAVVALMAGCWSLTDHPPAGTPPAGTAHPAATHAATHAARPVATHRAKPAATRVPAPASNPAHPKPAATATPMPR
jgi:ferredoxin